ncbi:DnaA regulatory inactivator Hda [Candidatus Woesearchaeota archaeon]|nr:DnaA regulatory inactivator Hda [Candidatus Woesearchaeota archaeon]
MAEQIPLHFAFDPELSFQCFHPGVDVEVVRHLQETIKGQGDWLIFLWGESGSGKTHLLNACCREASPLGLSISYLPLTVLVDYGPQVLEGLDQQDLVCIDDLDAVVGLSNWEQALFHFFNELKGRNGLLIVSARMPPVGLPIALPDLKTRFGWGLTLRLHPLREEDKRTLLERHAHSLGLELSPQVAQFLLTHFPRDLSSQRKLLDELDQATLAAKRKLTIPFLKTCLEQRS